MWITFCQEVLLDQTIASVFFNLFLPLSMEICFWYTFSCGKICNAEKSEKEKKAWFFN